MKSVPRRKLRRASRPKKPWLPDEGLKREGRDVEVL